MLRTATPNNLAPARHVGPAVVDVPADAAGPAGRPLHIVAAHADPAAAAFYRDALPRLGHRVQVARTGPELVQACRLLGPDLVLTAHELPGLDGLAAAEAVCRERPVPVVLVWEACVPPVADRAVAGEWVMACLPWPVGEAALGGALAVAAQRFDQLRALRAEAAELRRALEERKVVERAKGAVCRRTGLPEDEAYRRMRVVASRANRKLADVGRQILEAEDAFRALDGSPAGPGRVPGEGA